MSQTVETYEFQTEARQLLDLMIHSVYSHKDIFLRELISNSSDALDKRRFEAVQRPELMPEEAELHISLAVDKDARTLSITDNGIGMTHDEVRELIGTIAKSGTREFLKRVRETKAEGGVSPELIGQFGVGFYSSFMVADKVTLVTRKAGEQAATRWESAGDGTYTLQHVERHEAGTTVTLHLKKEEDEDFDQFLEEWKLRQIVKQYSDFVAYPIHMEITRTKHEEGEEDKTETTLETLNSMKAIWLREKSEVEEEEYNEFYKHISHDWNDPLSRIQAKIEGTLEYRLLLYIPSKAPFDLFYPRTSKHGVHLYIKRIFIMDDCTDLLPDYLRFVRGVVDSEDLTLNISREMLQQNRQIQRMSKGIVSKVLAHLKELRDREPEKFKQFWKEFGRVLKEGLLHDPENKDALLDLVLLESTNDPAELTTLQSYVDRMKADQDAIYYMTGESRKIIENSPHLEAFQEKGFEVLLLSEPVDEVWSSSIFEFKGKKLQSAGKGTVELGSEDEKKQAQEARKKKEQTHASLLEFLKEQLKDQIKEVRLSTRLKTSAACLVSDAHDISPQLEQMMKAMGQEVPHTKRILELNPDHPVLEKLKEIFEKDQQDAVLTEYAEVLYGQALLAEGGALPDPAHFSKLVTNLLVRAL